MNIKQMNRKLKIIAPATGELLAEIEETAITDVEIFYERGRQAFLTWRELTLQERLNYLRTFKQYIVDHLEEVVEMIAKDTGKVLSEALVADVMPTLDAINYLIKHSGKILRTRRVSTPLLLIGKKSSVEYMPRGVVLVISPWNYPFQLAVVPMLSALVSGNTVILKPSEVTPLVGKWIEELFQKAGFPPNVVQVAHGGKEVGAAFTKGKPDYIFFTGSVKTGKLIQAEAAKNLIPTTLELGGKDPMIVFADANLKRAAKGAAWAAFTNSGQVCMSAERLYVEETVYDKFLQLLKEEVQLLRHGVDQDADIGSMTFPAQINIVKHLIEDAVANGAELETGENPAHWKEEMFLPLTIISNVTHEMKIMQEEVFGPVLPVMPFANEHQAIELANDTEYGLNASVWTSDREKARRVTSRLVSGAVVINDVIVSIANHGLPFGGEKSSGLGKYHGEAGLRIFCHEKAIVEDRGLKRTEIQWFPYQGKYPLFVSLFKSYFHERRNWVAFLRAYLSLLKK